MSKLKSLLFEGFPKNEWVFDGENSVLTRFWPVLIGIFVVNRLLINIFYNTSNPLAAPDAGRHDPVFLL